MYVGLDLRDLTGLKRESAPMPVAYLIALAAVAMAVFSRALVDWIGLPGVLNFIHFPLTFLALMAQRLNLRFWRACGMFLGWVVFSAAVNGVELLRILLASIVWLEPLALGYVVWQALEQAGAQVERWTAFGRRLLWILIGSQLVLMASQYFQPGGADRMQGTFIGGQTGAHVAAALALIGSTICLQGILTRTGRTWLLQFIFLVAGLVLALLGNARAVVASWLFSIIVGLVIALSRASWRRILPRLIVCLWTLVLVTLVLVLAQPDLRAAGVRPEVIEGGLATKWEGMERLWRTSDPATLVAGHGPGMTVSRVALETPEAKLDPDSPIALLGLETSEFTKGVIEFLRASELASSLFSPWSSLAGVFGDVGIVGLALYGWAWSPLIRHAANKHRGADVAVVSLSLFTVLLGLQQIYLEDPGYILPFALFLGISSAYRYSGWMWQRRALTPNRLRQRRALTSVNLGEGQMENAGARGHPMPEGMWGIW